MAKTFKNVTRPADAAEISKPISERDFFDLTTEPIRKQNLEDKEDSVNTSNTHNTDNSDNTSNTGTITPSVEESAGVRQTFVLSRGHLEQLRDYVHARRTQGDVYYSQKQALQEALELLFATAAPAPPRPAQARAREQEHRDRIQQGHRGKR
ncbi:hypothetical protein Q5H93_23490 [Hymenobacter sp. ASUV-10]|uniref:Uncharacterized protein n=1 Tax=Hymenobacter aranciens TaxID=3063996 RepID=A0ABT9BIW7_9BACT|nr:hypothetical protein [Hymenobacter sp. ASUV-10]MDO7877720.1 hypothetical protein [Hymenobacter sp. ASUV-10]